MKPSVGRIVHCTSHGTPPGSGGLQAFASACRAAIVTEIDQVTQPDGSWSVGLCVMNPTGLFLNQHVKFHDGAETPGDPECTAPHAAGPHRYCACGWAEASHRGGTWHWPEREQ